jgi:hypothetical protein
MTSFIRFFRAILTLIEVFCFNPPPTIQENQTDNKEPDFL